MILLDTGFSIPTPLAPGDLILFGGHGVMSNIIKLVTDRENHAISHCGVMISETTIVESTSLDGHAGVGISHLEEWLYKYPGDVWLKYLTPDCMTKLDKQRMIDFLVGEDGTPYDKTQAFFSAFGFNRPDSWGKEKWYCSELAIAAYKQGNIAPINFRSGIAPAALANLPIFEEEYWQLKGTPRKMK